MPASEPRRSPSGQCPRAESPSAPALFTDLYELNMAQAYLERAMTGEAVFELFFRRMPKPRSFALAAGLGDVLDYLESWRVTGGELDYLRSLGQFSPAFLAWLGQARFTGEVWAVPEGSVVFEGEPILRVAAPIPQAQLVETFLMNQVHFQTVAAAWAPPRPWARPGRAPKPSWPACQSASRP